MYHGIILDLEFEDKAFPKKFNVFAKRKSTTSDWTIYGVEIADTDIGQTILEIQQAMKNDEPYYAHFYNNTELVVVFRQKIFTVTPDSSTWLPVVEYGKSIQIPEEQLDFQPNRFQDERGFFKYLE